MLENCCYNSKMDVDCMLSNYLLECRIGRRFHACKLFDKILPLVVDYMIANYFPKIIQWLLLTWLHAKGKERKKSHFVS